MPVVYNEDEKASIINVLKSNHCCWRCCNRFLGLKYPELYREDYEEPKIDDEENPNEECMLKKKKMIVCAACVGILEDLCCPLFFKKVVDVIINSNQQMESFLVALSIPPSVMIRQFALLFYLREKFPTIFNAIGMDDIVSVKEVWKWAAGPYLENLLRVPFQHLSPCEVGINIHYEDEEEECSSLLNLLKNNLKTQNKKKFPTVLGRSAVDKILSSISEDNFKKLVSCPPSEPKVACCCEKIICSHSPLYIAGRYNKFSRSLSQTPWILDGERLMESSVQELICEKIEPKVNAKEIKFSSSGREDVDVRTLGKGRPFLLEIINPLRIKFTTQDMRNLEKEINSSTDKIAVRDLQVVTKDETKNLKEGEIRKVKTYSCLCTSAPFKLNPEKVNQILNLKELKIEQKTPIRVLHRRPLAVRERVIHNMSVEVLPDYYHFKLLVTTQAGTYVKEFVHGDFGRTLPNVSSLLNMEVDILELDVEAVELDWPPAVNNEIEVIK